MAAMSERLTAIAFQPMSTGAAEARRKWTSSISRSVVASSAGRAAPRGPRCRRRCRPPRRARRGSRRRSAGCGGSARARPAAPQAHPFGWLRAHAGPRDAASSARKLRQQRLALARQDGLGMELHALDRVAAVAQPHDLAVLRPGGDLEVGGQALVAARPASGSASPRTPGGSPRRRRGRRAWMRRRLAVHLPCARAPPCPRRPGRSPGARGRRRGSARGRVEAADERRARCRRRPGLPGPGEMTMPSGASASHVVHGDRVVARHPHAWRPSSPRYWTRL